MAVVEAVKYLDKFAVSEITSVSTRTIDRHTFPRGTLECVRIGSRVLYSPDAVKRWLDAHRVGPDVTASAAS